MYIISLAATPHIYLEISLKRDGQISDVRTTLAPLHKCGNHSNKWVIGSSLKHGNHVNDSSLADSNKYSHSKNTLV